MCPDSRSGTLPGLKSVQFTDLQGRPTRCRCPPPLQTWGLGISVAGPRNMHLKCSSCEGPGSSRGKTNCRLSELLANRPPGGRGLGEPPHSPSLLLWPLPPNTPRAAAPGLSLLSDSIACHFQSQLISPLLFPCSCLSLLIITLDRPGC